MVDYVGSASVSADTIDKIGAMGRKSLGVDADISLPNRTNHMLTTLIYFALDLNVRIDISYSANSVLRPRKTVGLDWRFGMIRCGRWAGAFVLVMMTLLLSLAARLVLRRLERMHRG